MKKITLGVAVLLTLATTSCSKTSNIETTRIPSKAISLLKQNKFDTILVVKTVNERFDKSINMFDTKQNFKGTIKETNEEGSAMLLFFFIGILLGLGFGAALFL